MSIFAEPLRRDLALHMQFKVEGGGDIMEKRLLGALFLTF